jgi:hypothetical protein
MLNEEIFQFKSELRKITKGNLLEMAHMKPGEIITVKVLRAGRILQLSATRGP